MAAHEAKLLTPLFATGRTVASPGALRLMEELSVLPISFIARHTYGNWKDMCDQDQALNRIAAREGGRVFSSFDVGPAHNRHRIWVITEADRRVTTVLLPSEY